MKVCLRSPAKIFSIREKQKNSLHKGEVRKVQLSEEDVRNSLAVSSCDMLLRQNPAGRLYLAAAFLSMRGQGPEQLQQHCW